MVIDPQILTSEIERCINVALEEDLGKEGDITTLSVVNKNVTGRARVITKAEGIIAGLHVAIKVFQKLDPNIKVENSVEEGSFVKSGDEILVIKGKGHALLAGERTALNFLGRLSGIATLTKRFVDQVSGLGISILETRKTTPGLRVLEKYAVSIGGGENHRIGLFDRILLKENHFSLSGEGEGIEGYKRTIMKAVKLGRGKGPVTAEARNFEEVMGAVEAGADIILLDNMSVQEMRNAIESAKKIMREMGREVLFEASGGVNLDNVLEIAKTGVDRISIGALTHSVKPLDLSMLILKVD